jgi:hypothetical protein
MATEMIPVGMVFSMVQNTIYALPSQRVLAFTDGAAPTIQQSTTVAFTANVAVTLTGGQAELGGAFIRQTNLATCNIILSRSM